MAKIKKEIEINIGPSELALLFCEMSDRQQAQFFEEIATIVKTGPVMEWEKQFSMMCDALNDSGIAIIEKFGKYIMGGV